MASKETTTLSSSAVPSSRLGRLVRLGGMATGVAGNMLMAGAQQLAQGKRPKLSDLLLTPANALKITQQLSQMRGAAMKVGQLISMDAGDLLPPEMAAILARLRSDAHAMPQRQVQAVLTANWGARWQQRFASFSFTPVAAASIGQVHRATTLDGRDLAIKIQYPGVRKSISSDVDNVASLLRLSGLLPKSLDVAPLLMEAKRQLREEADYLAEGAHLLRFNELLAGDPEYVVPVLHADFTTRNVLAMSYVSGVSVESIETAPQAERDRMLSLLVDLLFRELFEFGLMQTDPNFANYRYDPESQQLILLDFGATRSFAPAFGQAYKQLMSATMAGDREIATTKTLLGTEPPRLPVAFLVRTGALFGLAEVRVEVAGAGDSKVTLQYLTLAEANALRNEIIARSAGVKPGTSALVESTRKRSMPSSPRRAKARRSVRRPSSGSWSILKSPVCSTVPAAVLIATASASGMEWLTAKNSRPNSSSCMRSPSATSWYMAVSRNRCSRNLPSTNANVSLLPNRAMSWRRRSR